MSPNVFLVAFGYSFAGLTVGVIGVIIASEASWCPKGGAVGVAAGLLWPLTLVVATLIGLVICIRATGRSVVVWWDALRPVAPSVAPSVAPPPTPPTARITQEWTRLWRGRHTPAVDRESPATPDAARPPWVE